MSSNITLLTDRKIIRITGGDKEAFLQNIVTQDINLLTDTQAIYSLLLTPQGKLIAEFHIVHLPTADQLLLDVHHSQLENLLTTLKRYILRSDVKLSSADDLAIASSASPITSKHQSWPDLRHTELGYRAVIDAAAATSDTVQSYHNKRINLAIPEQADFIEGRSFPVELGYDRLNAVSFAKGCYIGQEVTARSKHRGTSAKGIYLAHAAGALQLGDTVTSGDTELGIIRTANGTNAIAILRHPLVQAAQSKAQPIFAGTTVIELHHPEWLQDKKHASA